MAACQERLRGMSIHLMQTSPSGFLSLERYHAVAVAEPEGPERRAASLSHRLTIQALRLPDLCNRRPPHTAGWEGSCAIFSLNATVQIEVATR